MGTIEAYGTNIINSKGEGYTEITWDDWNALTPAQQQAIPRAMITDVPGVNGAVNAELMKVLWTNPNPGSAFAAQSIELSSSDYDYLLWSVDYSVNNYSQCFISEKGRGVLFTVAATSGGAYTTNIQRTVARTSDVQFEVRDCYSQNNNSSRTTSNSNFIPIAVYGIKKSISLDISALISNVSTSASKCMLSDGRSVENATIKSTEVTISGKTIAGNGKQNLGSIVSGLPSGSVLVSWSAKSGFDSDILPYVLGGIMYARNYNSSSITISAGKVDVFYI